MRRPVSSGVVVAICGLPRITAIQPRLEAPWPRGRLGKESKTMRTRLLTLREVADYLHVHPGTVYRLVKRESCEGCALGAISVSISGWWTTGS